MFKKSILSQAILSAAVSSSLAGYAVAQESPALLEEVQVTGFRASLERSMDIKRFSSGVVDAISAEDIGKFPDTNLAESMQRITGVSIDRVNGEGSQVTVRGFGAQYNLVTLNGRQMPTSRVGTIGGDQNADFSTGTSRSFEFANLASEGVSGLEVYKTGQASIMSGGIGATVNINTVRPLDGDSGFTGTVGAKLLHDTGVESGDDITPEFSGLVNWASDNNIFGVSLFGSYQERHTSTRSATVNGWNILTPAGFLDANSGMVRNDGSTVTNIDSLARDQYISVPNDSRWHLAEAERERINGILTLQYRPVDNLTLTADAFYAANEMVERRTDQTNWFNRPFNQVIFDQDPIVASTLYLQENIAGVKDTGFEQQYRAVDNTVQAFGINADWELSDTLRLNLDLSTGKSESLPGTRGTAGAPDGATSVLVSMGAPVISSHSLDFRTGFPVQSITIDDSGASSRGDFGGTNANGVLDAGDLGSQVARTISSSQTHELDAINLDVSWDISDSITLNAGIHHSQSNMIQQRTQTEQTLGDWGVNQPGDIPVDLVETYCLACLFNDYNPRASGSSLISFKANALELNDYLSPLYTSRGNDVRVTNRDYNQVEEDISAVFLQFNIEGDLAGLPTRTQIGLRYEETDITSTSRITVPARIIWLSDNDFTIDTSDEVQPVSITGNYNNLLPSVDFSVDLTSDLVARASVSKTIGRPNYGDLFASINAATPARPTALGGRAGGNSGNPNLKPLESTNIDLSLEWYFDDASYISGGFYEKRVKNFVGSGVLDQPLFGLRDPSSGAPGSRAGIARGILNDLNVTITDVHLFTMTALLDNRPSEQDAINEFMANYDGSDLSQAYVDQIIDDYDIIADANDPLFNFAVNAPINDREAKIYGFEFAIQHFFGNSGFGFQANYTTVTGDVGIDRGSNPSENQFALTGLSDTANLVLMYENHGLSARLAYNWRDKFLTETNRGSDRNPVFVEAYSQVDLNVTYDVTENLTIAFEGLNLGASGIRHYGRNTNDLWFLQELDTRYLLGARYRF